MSSEIQQYTDPATTDLVSFAEPRPVGSTLIREAAAVMADAHQIATAICSTAMVPQHFRNKPEECAAAMLYGASLGFDPMQSVRVVYVVNGNAALYASGMAAIVRRDGHELRDVEVSDTSVTVAGRRAGQTDWVERTWTIERAQTAGYTKNARYATNAQQMLHAKAVSEVCRVIAPDSLAGVYSVEERQMEYVEAEVVSTVPRSRGIAALLGGTTDRQGDAVAPRPGSDADASPAPTEDGGSAERDGGRSPSAARPLTDDQVSLLGTLLQQVGAADKATALAYVADVIGREIQSRDELTEGEAQQVIDALQAEIAEQQQG